MNDFDFIREFDKRLDRSCVPQYWDRDSRNQWAASAVKTFPGKRVLNVGGGGMRHLQKHLGAQWDVHELDITGNCDTLLDLDQVDGLPFEDGAFDTVCAFDVLEHLERFHLIAEELYRVSRKTIFLSLPNAAVEIGPIIRKIHDYTDPKNNGVYSKYYGLPLYPPTDRHRWWLTFEDIVRFGLHFEHKRTCKLEFMIPDDEFSLKRRLFRFIAGERLYLTFFCSTVWIRFTK